MADAVVIGAGPNGLVAANNLADAGWDVVVLEAEPEPGGAVRSSELTLPGYVHDRFSAFYPLGAGSPHIARLGLERHGLRWLRAPVVVADPGDDGSVALISADREETCASVDAFAPGDGDAWRELSAWWDGVGPRFTERCWTRSRRCVPAPGWSARWDRAARSTSRASGCSPPVASPASGSAEPAPRG